MRGVYHYMDRYREWGHDRDWERDWGSVRGVGMGIDMERDGWGCIWIWI